MKPGPFRKLARASRSVASASAFSRSSATASPRCMSRRSIARPSRKSPDPGGRKQMSSETAAIEKTLWTYLDGLHEGDADKIAQAFHPVSHLYSEANGEVADMPRDRWLDMVRSRPSAKSQGHPRHD